MLNSLNNDKDIICMQELYFDFNKQSRVTQKGLPVYPKGYNDQESGKTRAMLMVSRQITTNSWTRLEVNSIDVVGIHIKTEN